MELLRDAERANDARTAESICEVLAHTVVFMHELELKTAKKKKEASTPTVPAASTSNAVVVTVDSKTPAGAAEGESKSRFEWCSSAQLIAQEPFGVLPTPLLAHMRAWLPAVEQLDMGLLSWTNRVLKPVLRELGAVTVPDHAAYDADHALPLDRKVWDRKTQALKDSRSAELDRVTERRAKALAEALKVPGLRLAKFTQSDSDYDSRYVLKLLLLGPRESGKTTVCIVRTARFLVACDFDPSLAVCD